MALNDSNSIDKNIQSALNFCSSRLNYLHFLFMGNKDKSLVVLKELYNRASQNSEYLCTFHDASKIKSAKDFFVPILKEKYGEEYNTFIFGASGKTVENVLDEYDSPDFYNLNKGELFSSKDITNIISSIARNHSGKHENDKRFPLIFIDGIEELFFNLDYGNHADFLKLNFKDFSDGNRDSPELDKMFKILRSQKYTPIMRSLWNQFTEGDGARIHGVIRKYDGLESVCTLRNYDYLFYEGNFCPVQVD